MWMLGDGKSDGLDDEQGCGHWGRHRGRMGRHEPAPSTTFRARWPRTDGVWEMKMILDGTNERTRHPIPSGMGAAAGAHLGSRAISAG